MTPDFIITTSNWHLNHAIRMALGDLYGNIVHYQDGLLTEPQPCIMAGLWYDTPWTRDAAINTWNAAGLLVPEAAKHTLLSVLRQEGGETCIGGQYWDRIIWVIGAWQYYLYSGDRAFLRLAFDASRATMAQHEHDYFDADYGLFRGEACFHDGISAYPDRYVAYMGTREQEDYQPDTGGPIGPAIPYFTLSTNSLYYRAYQLLGAMAAELGETSDPAWAENAEQLKAQINLRFWLPDHGYYRYLVDPEGGDDRQDALGHAFALLFDIADAEQARQVLANQVVTPAGVPCIWPTFPRFQLDDLNAYGTHSGTVWPMVQGFWAEAAARHGRVDRLMDEVTKWTANIRRDNQCDEMYHPITGLPYGGLNDWADGTIKPHGSGSRQTWSATAYLRTFLFGLLGLRFTTKGVTLNPVLPDGLDWIEVRNLPYRDTTLTLRVEGQGSAIHDVRLNGESITQPKLAATLQGEQHLVITVQ